MKVKSESEVTQSCPTPTICRLQHTVPTNDGKEMGLRLYYRPNLQLLQYINTLTPKVTAFGPGLWEVIWGRCGQESGALMRGDSPDEKRYSFSNTKDTDKREKGSLQEPNRLVP